MVSAATEVEAARGAGGTLNPRHADPPKRRRAQHPREIPCARGGGSVEQQVTELIEGWYHRVGESGPDYLSPLTTAHER